MQRQSPPLPPLPSLPLMLLVRTFPLPSAHRTSSCSSLKLTLLGVTTLVERPTSSASTPSSFSPALAMTLQPRACAARGAWRAMREDARTFHDNPTEGRVETAPSILPRHGRRRRQPNAGPGDLDAMRGGRGDASGVLRRRGTARGGQRGRPPVPRNSSRHVACFVAICLLPTHLLGPG